MLHIAVCDDEKYMSDKIRMMVSDFFGGKYMDVVISQFSSGEELLKDNRTIDILFLDIQMKGMDGMETARKLRERKFKGILIFITVLKEMVFQSFEVQAFDYLVKPIEAGCFEKTMERLLCSMKNASESSLLVQRGYESSIILLQKRMKPYFYILFAILCMVVIKTIPNGGIIDFAVYVLLLVAVGIVICHTDWKTALLYAALTVEIMQLCYGIVNSLTSILYPLLC